MRNRAHQTLIALGYAILLLATTAEAASRPRPKPQPAPVNIGILSDLHVTAPWLVSPGSALETYLAQDPKLLAESTAILESAIDDLIARKVDFVIIPGDLTKDGEFTSHLQVTRRLQRLLTHGIKVYVVPGNHDINNPDAMRFVGDTATPVPSIQPGIFRALYRRFGYANPVSTDPASLSYIAEPAPGIWLFAIDSCRYSENTGLERPLVGGRIRPETMDWILAHLARAKAAGIMPVAFMHHGVNQDFLAQSAVFPEYLVDEWYAVGPTLATAGLRVVFTGHYHAQNAAYPTDAAGTPIPSLVDVATASLASYPCAFRTARLDPSGLMTLDSHRVTEVDAYTGNLPFQDYAYNFLVSHMHGMVLYRLTQEFQLPQPFAMQLEPFVTLALVAGYEGDQVMDPASQQLVGGLLQDPQTAQLGQLIGGLWANPEPADAQLQIQIK